MSKSTVIEDLPLPDDGEESDFPQPVPMPVPMPAPAQPRATEVTWQTLVMSPKFLKAVFLAFMVVVVALVVPLEDYVFRYVPVLATAPRAAEGIKALAAAAAITFLRPPDMSAN